MKNRIILTVAAIASASILSYADPPGISPYASQSLSPATGKVSSLVSVSFMYYYHSYSENEKDLTDRPTSRRGNETGGIPGGSIEYRLNLGKPNLFFSAGFFFSDADTDAEQLQMWNGNIDNSKTNNLFLLGQILGGTTLTLIPNKMKVELSTGIGLRAWTRTFELSDNAYADESYVFFAPYNVGVEYMLSDSMSLGLDTTFRILFSGKDTINLTTLHNLNGMASTDAFVNPQLLMASNVSTRIGLVGRYYFPKPKKQNSFFTVRSVTVNPYLDIWSTGQSNTAILAVKDKDGKIRYYVKPNDYNENNTGSLQNVPLDDDYYYICKWESLTNAWGARVTLDLAF